MTGSTTSFFSVSSVPSVSSACRSACSWFSSPKLLSLSVYLPSVLLFSFLSPGLPFLLSPGATPSLAPLGNCCPRAAARQRFASSRRLSVCASFVPSSLSVAFSSFPRRRKSAMHVGSFATSQRPDWAAGKLGTPLYPFSSSPLSSSAPSPPCSRSLSSSSSSSPSSSDEFSSSPRSPYRLQRAATSSAFGLPINCLHFDQLDSTQKWCLRSLQTLRDEHGLSPSLWVAVSATRQTAAVGTRHSGTHEEKKWVSPVNNVSVTYVIPWPVSLTSRLLNFAQTASAAVCKVLEEYQIRGQIKWINDVLVDGRKISGVLCHNPAFFLPSSPSTALATNDTHPVGGNLSAQGVQSLHAGDSTRQQYIAVLVGIGINVEKNPDLSSGGVLQQPVTSMAEEFAKVCHGGLRSHSKQEQFSHRTGGRQNQTLVSEDVSSGERTQASQAGRDGQDFAERFFPRDGGQGREAEADRGRLREKLRKSATVAQPYTPEGVAGACMHQGTTRVVTEDANTRGGAEVCWVSSFLGYACNSCFS